eukprot:TRINITY_DN2166_c0_g1_i2.p1 TRINITY_DN2166_c0_g1~~TRINITY_DN2166_c0_g1_i2.p1  ORF type:complete len:171 (+),score=5.19 TRINITY_DN2166_c0_g1_i2:143-655(+)
MADHDYALKLLLVGDSGVGKSSILLRFTENQFDEDSGATIGVDFKVKYLLIDGRRIKLTIWDTAGQERFRTLTSAYYRNAHGVILMYDVTSRESLQHVTNWLREIKSYSTFPDVAMLLVGNKSDLMDRCPPAAAVPTSEAEDFARTHGMLFMQCSAKTRDGVHQVRDAPS